MKKLVAPLVIIVALILVTASWAADPSNSSFKPFQGGTTEIIVPTHVVPLSEVPADAEALPTPAFATPTPALQTCYQTTFRTGGSDWSGHWYLWSAAWWCGYAGPYGYPVLSRATDNVYPDVSGFYDVGSYWKFHVAGALNEYAYVWRNGAVIRWCPAGTCLSSNTIKYNLDVQANGMAFTYPA